MKIIDFMKNYSLLKEKGIRKDNILVKEVNIRNSHTLVCIFNTSDKTYYYFDKILEKNNLIQDDVPKTFEGYKLALN